MSSFAKQTPTDANSDVEDNTLLPSSINVRRIYLSPEAAKSDAFREQERKRARKRRNADMECQLFSDQRDESLNDPAPLDASSSSSSNATSTSILSVKSDTLVTRAYLRRVVEKNTQFHKLEIDALRYENEILKATVRQYRTKARKIRRLANAAITRDDHLMEAGNANLEQQPPKILKGEIKSDSEDGWHRNHVRYRYVDHSDSEECSGL